MQKLISRYLNYSYFILNALVSLGFLIKGEPTLIANTAATSIFFLSVILIEKFTSFKLKNFVRLLVIITLTSHSLLGEYFRLYYTTNYFDNLLHFFGSFSYALFGYAILNAFLVIQSSRPRVFAFIWVSLLGICSGTFFELFEFALDQLLDQRNQFGLIDTNWDLFFDVLGSFSAGLIAVYRPIYSLDRINPTK